MKTHKIIVVALMALLTVTFVSCGKRPTDYVGEVTPGVFETIDEAAVQALVASGTLSIRDRYEWGGIVVKSTNGYGYTAPVTSYDTNQVTFTIPKELVRSTVAIYHTHPCSGHNQNGFPPHDQRTAAQLNVPTYIVDLCNNNVYRYDPDGIILDPMTYGTFVTNINNRIK